MVEAIRIWFTIFVCCPAPWSPWRTTVDPMSEKQGATAATTSAGPPTMIEREAERAPISPPETGASRTWTPCNAAASAKEMANDGFEVVMSMRTAPREAPCKAPFWPRRTSSTSLGNPTMEKTKSLCSATKAGVPAQVAPAARRPWAFSGERVEMQSSKPPESKCLAIAAPMTPVPIHPILVRPGEAGSRGAKVVILLRLGQTLHRVQSISGRRRRRSEESIAVAATGILRSPLLA